MTSVAKHKNSALRLLRRALLIFTLLCLPTIGEAQKTRILPPKRPNKPAVKPKPKPASKPKKKVPTVSEPTGYINGHGYVDLGLPSGTKWATCNVGASSPGDYGDYFAWGEISPKSTYTEENSATFGRKDIGDISGNPSMDAARANWGSTWRLPTWQEVYELYEKCGFNIIHNGGHFGFLFKGPNGNSVFFPYAGYRSGSSIIEEGKRGLFWSSTPHPNLDALGLKFCDGYYGAAFGVSRVYGLSVRPVSE